MRLYGWTIGKGGIFDSNTGAMLKKLSPSYSSPLAGAGAIGSKVVLWSGAAPSRGNGPWDQLDEAVNGISVYDLSTHKWECQ